MSRENEINIALTVKVASYKLLGSKHDDLGFTIYSNLYCINIVFYCLLRIKFSLICVLN